IDSEIREMLDEAYETARTILTDHMTELKVIAQALLEREKLSGEQFTVLMNGGTLPPEDTEDEVLPAAAEKAEEATVKPTEPTEEVKTEDGKADAAVVIPPDDATIK
ncbi:MAG: hypothetical protein RSF73_08355, partial [Ruthenibacterium sp.]